MPTAGLANSERRTDQICPLPAGSASCPHLAPFGAIGADIDMAAPAQDLPAKLIVRFAGPDRFEGLFPEVAQLMAGVLIEATGNNPAVPGNHAGMPHFPAVIGEGVAR